MRCGPGCHWSDLIKVLNAHGKSPRTMQSYCSFSVGGTLAVNAHGITTDYCFAESVIEFRLARVTSKGNVQVIVCRPGEKSLSSELFSLALGGYGLFGVITEVLLKVENNVQLELNTMNLNVQPPDNLLEDVHPSEFVRVYDNCRNSKLVGGDESSGLGKVEMKLARLNTVNLEKASFYVFRRSFPSSTVSELPPEPRTLSPVSRLLYKWAMPLLKDLRYAKEETSGKALDWSQEDGSTRNQLLFESAVPMSRLYNPLVTKDDTFVLQEFFCPHDKFSQWIDAVKPIYKDIEDQQQKFKHELILLNTTIRYVEQDDTTFLSYSRVPGGVFAFVLYYRINRSEATEKRLGEFHNRLADVTVSMGGSFYLPYRKCYSPTLLKAAYPMIEKFAEMKQKFDPDCVFSNLWFEHYILPMCTQSYRSKWTAVNSTLGTETQRVLNPLYGQPSLENGKNDIMGEREFFAKLPRQKQKDILRRKNSYRNLLRSKDLRDQFKDQFLVQIFNLAVPDEVMRVMSRAAWDPANQYDIHIYKCIHNHFHGQADGNRMDMAALPRIWRGIQQLRQQKKELTRQTLSIVSKLDMLDKIKNYVCIGDNGKTVIDFTNELNITGKVWVIHNEIYVGETLPPIGVVLERGSLDSVAHEEIAFDYVSDLACKKLDKIASESIDMITMNQGLHHIPLEKLYGFLTEVMRILRPGGIFIIREHDLKLNPGDGKVPYPMLDLAHSVFNAVTGVSLHDEREEVRAFRPILEWREILENVGFVDSLIYEVEDGDPTWDEMMCFLKRDGGTSPDIGENTSKEVLPQPRKSLKEDGDPPIIGLISTLLSQVPEFVVSNAATILKDLAQFLPKIENKLSDLIMITIPYLITQNDTFGSESRTIAKQVGDILEPILTACITQMLGFVNGSIALLSESELKTAFNFKNLVNTKELYLIMPYLQRKVQSADSDANEMEKNIVNFLQEYLPSLLPPVEGSIDHDDDSSNCGTIISQSGKIKAKDDVADSEVQEFVQELADTLPDILDMNLVMVQSGLTLPQQTSLVGKFGGYDLPSASSKLCKYLDRNTWNELKKALRLAVGTKALPTKSRLLENNHPWRLALLTFFKSPKVTLTQKPLLGLRLIGLGELGNLYKEAKKESKKDQSQSLNCQYESDIVSHLQSLNTKIEETNREWTEDIVERRIKYRTNDIEENCLWDVAEIIDAKFGYNSVTSRKVDITIQLQTLHASIHAKLANQDYKFLIPDGVQMGWLPIHESLLSEMRNKGSKEKEFGDILRKSFVNVATLGAAGHNQLKIKYRRISGHINGIKSRQNLTDNQKSTSVESALSSGHFDSLQALAKEVCAFLESNDLLRSDLHPDDGPFTWFKLNEWMQVEILDELVKSLDHTPWYRFPFTEFMTTYFTVFQQQCNIIQEKYGFIAAYGSFPFLTDLVPGIIMTILFGQLRLLAIPLELAFPNGYDNDKMNFREEIVIHLPRNHEITNNWDTHLKSSLDERILEVKLLPNNFMICSVPPFKTMGEILEKIAIRFPSARVFQISNQYEVQVRVSFWASRSPHVNGKHEDDLQELLSIAGIKRKMEFQYPNTRKGHVHTSTQNEQSKINYSLEVHCLALLDVFRFCNIHPNFEVDQVFDFWN